MAAIAGRISSVRQASHGWVAWFLLAIPALGIGGLTFRASRTVVKPTISVFQALEANDIDALKAHALTGTDLNEKAADGYTVLYKAIENYQFEAAKALIDGGANPNSDSPVLETPLMRAASIGDADTVRALLSAGARPNDSLRNGMTAIYSATMNGNDEIVKLLLAEGASPNPETSATVSLPLCVAAWRGDSATATILLRSGAESRSDATGRTPLQLARQRDHKAVIELLTSERPALVLGPPTCQKTIRL